MSWFADEREGVVWAVGTGVCTVSGTFRTLLLDRHSELRSGWRIAGFVCLVVALTIAAITPLRIAGLDLPLAEHLIFLSAALGASAVFTRYANGKPLGAVGLWLHYGTFKELGMGCLLGFLMMAGIYIIEYGLGYLVPAGRVLGASRAAAIVGYSLLWFGTDAMAEELLFRGYAFQTLIQAVTFLPAAILMAVFFGLIHIQNPHVTLLSLSNVFLVGVLFSFAYMKTRSLWLPFGIHFAWNFSQTTLFGFPTSGLLDRAQVLFPTEQRGPEWISGGEFGPEGGILATLAIVLCLWYILKARFLKAPEGIITLDSIEDLLGPGNGGKGRGL